MNVTRRHATWLFGEFRPRDTAGLMSKRRGRPSNRRHTGAFRGSLRDDPRAIRTSARLAAEKLAERHDVTVSKEMVEAGLWEPYRAKERRAAAPALASAVRRAGADRRLAALVVRGARAEVRADRVHRRRNGRDPSSALLPVGIDLRLSPGGAGEHCLLRQGHRVLLRPLNLPAHPKGGRRRRPAASTRARRGSAAQAKGGVERLNKTLQDRRVQELRLAGIASIDAARSSRRSSQTSTPVSPGNRAARTTSAGRSPRAMV